MHNVGTDDSLSEATAAPYSPVGELAVVLEASLLLALSTRSLPLKLHGTHLGNKQCLKSEDNTKATSSKPRHHP